MRNSVIKRRRKNVVLVSLDLNSNTSSSLPSCDVPDPLNGIRANKKTNLYCFNSPKNNHGFLFPSQTTHIVLNNIKPAVRSGVFLLLLILERTAALMWHCVCIDAATAPPSRRGAVLRPLNVPEPESKQTWNNSFGVPSRKKTTYCFVMSEKNTFKCLFSPNVAGIHR